MKRSSSKLKKLLIFQKGVHKAPKTNKISTPQKFLVSCDIFLVFAEVKYREIPCERNLSILRTSFFISMFKEYKRFRYFVKYSCPQEIELPSSNLKKCFIFQEGTYTT